MPTTDNILEITELQSSSVATEEETTANEETASSEAGTEEHSSVEETETYAETTAEAGGVWQSIGGKDDMPLTDALSISVVGFGIVFAVLGFLAIFVFAMGKVFESIGKNAEKKKEAKAEEIVQNSVKSNEYPLPDNQSVGDLTLINTTEEEAAVIMAITSNKSGIPLNRLKFNSIKLLEDDKN